MRHLRWGATVRGRLATYGRASPLYLTPTNTGTGFEPSSVEWANCCQESAFAVAAGSAFGLEYEP